ncbi:tRNA 2-thiouridine(34) synthase MnmA [Galbitalea sp. SE-J8]|uniref:tRNA 2-thiouridine(34) synthase MnmA n=1 Tax=Galbitalea sp. SE-J8 TaxID=3054952 RepID=UPI00259D0CA3|nr:tRNA 2-thiouridine(34) synthase MnmA [Galbitalea sp. SE-J8]MDM4763814.1 tRNA 2-thiouridine(34) synthase MnmA [Galbitalea sp. SE-J8]
MRVLAAMSGGVDSAVAAARAVDAGHDVVGVHLALSRMPGTLRTGSRGCCTIEDSMDAQRAATVLGIPYYVWDFSERFKLDVVDDFIAEYAAGRTPNPCMRCNERIKFAALLEKALSLGFDAVATGHYASIVTTDDGHRELHRAAAWAKDQSYVLGVLTGEQLAHAMFPLGATPSKAEVRAEAAARGLSVAAKPDSHDICFISDGDTRGWLAEKVGAEPGPIVDRSGATIGTHRGAAAFTVGQRKGLDLRVPAPDGRPRFVLEVKPRTNEVVVGPREALAIAEFAGERMSWAGRDPVASGLDPASFRCEAQIRAHADPVPATAAVVGAELVIRPDEPILGVAPGQTAVVYVGTRVLGQCTIDRTVSAAPARADRVPV